MRCAKVAAKVGAESMDDSVSGAEKLVILFQNDRTQNLFPISDSTNNASPAVKGPNVRNETLEVLDKNKFS